MRTLVHLTVILILWQLTVACSVISRDVRAESETSVSFDVLLREVDSYTGRSVLLGGYILQTRNIDDFTIITVLQTPLAFRDEPRSRDYSQGRFIVYHTGFLDPEVYGRNRKITIAGILLGKTVEKLENTTFTYLRIESRQIYLWPAYDVYYYNYPYYEPREYPYIIQGYPYPYRRW